MAEFRSKSFRNFFCEFKEQVAAFAEPGESPTYQDVLQAAKDAWTQMKVSEKKLFNCSSAPVMPRKVMAAIKKLARQANASLKQTNKRSSKSASPARTKESGKGGKGRSGRSTCRNGSKSKSTATNQASKTAQAARLTGALKGKKRGPKKRASKRATTAVEKPHVPMVSTQVADQAFDMQELDVAVAPFKSKKRGPKVPLKKRRAVKKAPTKRRLSKKRTAAGTEEDSDSAMLGALAGNLTESPQELSDALPPLSKKRGPKAPVKKNRAVKKAPAKRRLSKKRTPAGTEEDDDSTGSLTESTQKSSDALPPLSKKRGPKAPVKKNRAVKKAPAKRRLSKKRTPAGTEEDADSTGSLTESTQESSDALPPLSKKRGPKVPFKKRRAIKKAQTKRRPRKKRNAAGADEDGDSAMLGTLAGSLTESARELSDVIPPLNQKNCGSKVLVKQERAAERASKNESAKKNITDAEIAEAINIFMQEQQAAMPVDECDTFNMEEDKKEMQPGPPHDDEKFMKELLDSITCKTVDADEEDSCSSSDSQSDSSSEGPLPAASAQKPHFPVSDKGREIFGHIKRGLNPNQSADGFNGTDVDVTELIVAARKLDTWKRKVLENASKRMNIDDFYD